MAKKPAEDIKEIKKAADDVKSSLTDLHTPLEGMQSIMSGMLTTQLEVNEHWKKTKSLINLALKESSSLNGISISLGKQLTENQQMRIKSNKTAEQYVGILNDTSTIMLEQANIARKSANLDIRREKAGLGVANIYEKHSDLMDSITAKSENLKDIALSQLEVTTDMINNDLREVELSDDKLRIEQELVQITQRLSKIKDTNSKYSKSTNNLEREYLETLQAQLQTQQTQMSAIQSKQKMLKVEQGLVQESYGKMTEMTDSFFSSIERIPGGGFISKAFNFDGIKENINKKIGSTLQNAIAGAGKQVTIFGKTFTMALGPVGLIVAGLAAAAAIGAALWSSMNKVSELQSEIVKEQGISNKEAQQQVAFTSQMANSTNDIWVNSEGIREATADVRNQLGGMLPSYENMNQRGKDLIMNQQELTKQLGLSNDEATNFQNTAQMLGVSTDELVGTVGQVEGAIKATTGGTVNTKEIMQDIAAIQPSIIAGFKGSTVELVATVAKAKALGMSLEQINSIGEASLDIESSLGKEMEARVLTGRNINLDAMRQAQLMGDQTKVMEELVKNAGTYSEFKEMDSIQQKALAEAMGMSTNEMTEMLQKAELQAQVGQDLDKLSADELDRMIKQGELRGEDAIAMAEKLKKEKRSASVNESLSKIWDKIKDVIFGIVSGPLGDMANKMTSFLGDAKNIDPIINAVKDTFSVLGGIISFVVDLVGMMLGTISKIIQGVDWFFSLFSSGKEEVEETEAGFGKILKVVGLIGAGIVAWKKLLKPAVGKLGDFASGIKDKLMPGGKSKAAEIVSSKKSKGPGAMEKFAKGISKLDPKKLLAGGAAMVLIASSVFIMAKAMQEFSEVTWEGVAMGITSMLALVGAVSLLGLIMTSGVGTVAILAGAAAMLIIAGAMWILGKAMQEFAVAFNMMIPPMQVGFGLLNDLISTIGGAISGVVTSIGDSMEKVFGSIALLASIEGGGANLLAMGAGLVAIAVGLGALTAGSIIDGIASLFGGGSAKWLDTLREASEINGDGISKVGEGLMSIANAFQALAKVDLDKVEKALDKVEDIQESSFTDKLTKAVEVITSSKGSGASQTSEVSTPNSDSDVQTQTLELLKMIYQSLAQPVNLNLDGQTLGKLEKATTLNRQMRLGVDNSYGQTVQ